MALFESNGKRAEPPFDADNGRPATNGHGLTNGHKATNGCSRRPLHRIKTVRQRQGMSLRTVARHLGSTIRDTRSQEDECTDLRLSDLYRWQAALDVPLEELLVESDLPLSRPVMERAQLVRVMKTVMALLELAPNAQVRRLAERLIDQLTEFMPELKGVGPWHAVGQRRALDEYGRIVENRLPDDFFHPAPLDNTD